MLDIGCGDLGSHISRIGGKKIIPTACSKLEGVEVPDQKMMTYLKDTALRTYKKIGDENSRHYGMDNTTCILRYSRGCMSKLYNFITRIKFIYIVCMSLL